MIYLKSLTESDLPFLLEIRNDDSTRCNLENNSKFTLKESLEWFKQNKLYYPYVIDSVDIHSIFYILPFSNYFTFPSSIKT